MRYQPTLKKGDQARLKVRTMAGWKGMVTITEDQRFPGPDEVILFSRNDTPEGWKNQGSCMRHELAIPRKPKP